MVCLCWRDTRCSLAHGGCTVLAVNSCSDLCNLFPPVPGGTGGSSSSGNKEELGCREEVWERQAWEMCRQSTEMLHIEGCWFSAETPLGEQGLLVLPLPAEFSISAAPPCQLCLAWEQRCREALMS